MYHNDTGHIHTRRGFNTPSELDLIFMYNNMGIENIMYDTPLGKKIIMYFFNLATWLEIT